MKRARNLMILLAAAIILAGLPTMGRTEGKKKLTLMVYMCGSNLESDYGAATEDILEMLNAGVNTEEVNVLVMTGGSGYWFTRQSPEYLAISLLGEGQMDPVWAGGKASMGEAKTLAGFLEYGYQQYPAENHALILWDHGGGPLLGVCSDELFAGDTLNLTELTKALEEIPRREKLSWIGFDACLMGSAEVALSMAPYAEYMIASQETEPGTGWDYSFLRGIEKDESGAETGKRIVDCFIEGTEKYGITLSCLDLGKAEAVSRAMDDFFGKVRQDMGVELFGRLSNIRMASTSFGKAVVRGSSSYDLVDLEDLVGRLSDLGDTSELRAALKDMVVYSRDRGIGAGGVTVYHPMLNKLRFLRSWREAYSELNYGTGYKQYVKDFGNMLTGRPLADWSGTRLEDGGIGQEGENQYRITLNEQQKKCFSSAQLVVMAMTGKTYDGQTVSQLTEGGASPDQDSMIYYPVSVRDVAMDENGILQAPFYGESLYVTDGNGEPVAGPVSYEADGGLIYVKAYYMDNSGREDSVPNASVIHICSLDPQTLEAPILSTYVYDRVTDTYTQRISFDMEDYTDFWIEAEGYRKPEGNGLLPGLAEWETGGKSRIEMKLPLNWKLKFLGEQLTGTPLYATLQVTDTQQNTYCTPLVRVENPNLYKIAVTPRTLTGPDFTLNLYAVQDTSRLYPGLSIGVELKNTSDRTLTYTLDRPIINGTRSVNLEGSDLFYYKVGPGQSVFRTCKIEQEKLLGLRDLDEISLYAESRDESSQTHAAGRVAFGLKGYEGTSMKEEQKPLASVSDANMEWELVALEKNIQGGLNGLMHVVNNGEKSIFLSGNMVVNGTVQTDDKIYVRAEAKTDVYVPFTISNRAVGGDLIEISGLNMYYTLGLDHLLEQYGVTSIETLQYCVSEDFSNRNILFSLPSPLAFASGEEVALAQRSVPVGESQLLLDGDISVYADRMVVADNGVTIRMTVRNNSNRDIKLHIDNKRINERDVLDLYGDTVALGAGASTVTCVGFRPYSEDLKKVRDVKTLDMTFRYEGYTTNRAEIRLNSTTAMGAEKGTYLSPADFRAEAAEYKRPTGIRVDPAPLKEAESEIRMSVKISNREQGTPDGGKNSIKLEFMFRNQSRDVLKYTLDRFAINDRRSMGDLARLYSGKLNPGETDSEEEELDLTCLTDLDEIHSISCTMTVERNGDYNDRTEYPVRFQVFDCGLEGLVPTTGNPIAEKTKDGVTWRLYSLENRDDGGVRGLMSIHNDTDKFLDGKYTAVMMEGIQTTGYVDAELAGGMERYSRLEFANGVALDYPIKAETAQKYEKEGKIFLSGMYERSVLQRMGIGQVSSIELLLNQNNLKGTLDGSVLLKLKKPFRLGASKVKETMLKGGNLLRGDVSVTVTRYLSGDNGAALTLVMHNDTAVPVHLEMFAVAMDGHPLEGAESFCLPPHAIKVSNVGLSAEKVMSKGDKYREITMCFLVDDELYEGAALRVSGALGDGKLTEGTKVGTQVARARTSPAVYEKLLVPAPGTIHNTQLEAPVSKRNTENVASGEALICARDVMYETNAAGEREEKPYLRILTRVPLNSKNGRLMANYSGMSLQYKNWVWMESEEAPAGGNGGKIKLDMVLFTSEEPLEGDFPEGGVEALDHGILAHYEWSLKYNQKSITVSGMQCKMTDLATGKNVNPKDYTMDKLSSRYTLQHIIPDPDNPGKKGIRPVSWSGVNPLLLQMNGRDSLEKEVFVLYEIRDKDGSIRWLEGEIR